ncbi:unnamed protein product [Rhizophagus irregularis]|nr:unnamed protein product [Rhizophagus irregularis]
MPRGEKAPPGVIVWFQECGWMNADLMKHYVSYLNQIRMSSGQSRLPAMMVYDSFRGHLEESVKQKFKDNHVELAMNNGGAGYTAAGNLRRAKISEVCGWVKRSWENVSEEIIIRAFKKCGISNALDETEDDEIYKEIDEVLNEIQNEMDNNVEEEMEEMEIIDL